MDDINAVYNTMMIPKRNRSEPLKVKFAAYLRQIIELNERDQAISLDLIYRYAWKDDFLAWNPAMHGNIKQIVVKAESIWTPDITLLNSKSDDFNEKLGADVTINFKGEAKWIPLKIQTSTCEGYFHFIRFSLKYVSMLYLRGDLDYTK